MALDYGSRDRQAQTRPFDFQCDAIPCAEVALEDAILVMVVDTNARIFDGNDRFIYVPVNLNKNLASIPIVFDGISDQIIRLYLMAFPTRLSIT